MSFGLGQGLSNRPLNLRSANLLKEHQVVSTITEWQKILDTAIHELREIIDVEIVMVWQKQRIRPVLFIIMGVHLGSLNLFRFL